MAVTEQTREQMREILARYPRQRSALMPLLHLAQADEGAVTTEGIAEVASMVGLTEAEVTAVASFYTMYVERQSGEHRVGVCINSLCALLGGDEIWNALTEHCGVGHGQTTADGKVTLERIECQAACTHAPVMTADWEFLDDMTVSKAKEVVDALRAGEPVQSTRGPMIRSFKEAERTIAGIDDSLTNEGDHGDDRMLAGLKLAKANGDFDAARLARRKRLKQRQPAGERSPDMPLTPLLSAHWDEPDSHTIDGYRRHGGYESVSIALGMQPDEVVAVVKDSGLRGRGGAGFPTGMKWGFVPQGDGKPHYLVINADESEPGACKDIPLMLANPHSLVEGVIAASYAIRANHAFIYVRGEVPHAIRRMNSAVREAYAAGYLGKDIQGSGFDLEVVVHSGAGAYICGEETALLDSLEGFRGQPRLKPPFPAVAGLYASPTVVNNVETIASVPAILVNGAQWYKSFGSEKSPGIKLFAVSGHVERPGIYEAPMGTTMRELLEWAGGIRSGHQLKFWVPGGSSVPLLTEEHLDVPLHLRGHRGGRIHAGHRYSHGVRRDHERDANRHSLAGVLQARVVWQVHALPRGHLLAGGHVAKAGVRGRQRR